MNRTLKIVGFTSLALSLAVVGFTFGYYNGYVQRARISSAFDLSVSENYYEAIQNKRPESALPLLRAEIVGTNNSLRQFDDKPLRFFMYEMSHAYVGKKAEAEALSKADKLISEDALMRDLYSPSNLGRAIPSH
jgi:hypothetical protein